MRYLCVLLLLCSISVFSQNWLRVDSVFSPSGVTVQSFSAPVFCDIDNDGDFDLFLGNINLEVDFFRNIGTNSQPFFAKDRSVMEPIYAGGYQFTNSDYPAIVDLNGDGLYDLCIGGYNGILYYENRGTPTNPSFVKVDTIFTVVNTLIGSDAKPVFIDIDGDGDFDLYVGIGESLLGGPTPGITIAFRNVGSATNPIFSQDNTLSVGIADVGLNAYPTFADLNNDGDYDLLMGRDLSSFVYYQNVGNAQAPLWQMNQTLFSAVENSRYWKNPTFCDLDGDGDFDLIYGTDSGLLYFYENIGTQTNPQFQLNTSYFKVIKLEGGSASVSFADIDGDGDLDMISGTWDGKFAFFKNNGTNKSPKFDRSSAAFTNFDVGSYSYPIFVDLDNDGDYDIVSGELNGTLFCYINNNGVYSLNNSVFAGIDVGYSSIPAAADLNGDGLVDLIIGGESGANTIALRNMGNLQFTQDNSLIGGITFNNYIRLTLADVDNDGDNDLVIGRSFGELVYYENIGEPSQPVWMRNDSLFAGIKVKQNAAPGFGDLDGDGRMDMVIGEYDGNFTFFKNLFAISDVKESILELPSSFIVEQNYPNPFNAHTIISYFLPEVSDVEVSIHNLLGEKIDVLFKGVANSGYNRVFFDSKNLSSGVYFYMVSALSENTNKVSTITKKMVLLK